MKLVRGFSSRTEKPVLKLRKLFLLMCQQINSVKEQNGTGDVIKISLSLLDYR